MAKPTRYTPEIIKEYFEKGYWESTTIVDFWDRNAREFPDKEAVVDSKTRLTFAQAKQRIDRLSLALLELGFTRDELIVAQIPNCVELCLLRVACEKAGLVFMPVLRTLRHREMEYILGWAEAAGVAVPWHFRDFDHFQMINELRPNLPKLRHVFIAGDEVPPGAMSLDSLSKQPLEEKYPPDYLDSTKLPATEFSLVVQTTGTTGFPKFVEHAIGGRVYTAKGHIRCSKLSSKDIVAALGPAASGPNAVVYCGVPQVAAKIVMLERFDAEEALKLIEKEKVTVACLVPAMLAMMVKHPNFGKYDVSSLRVIISSGASLLPQLAVEAEEKMGCPTIQMYGSNDGGGLTMQSLDAPPETRRLTVGKPYPGNEVKLFNDAGEEVDKSEGGEITVRGPTMDMAYFRDTETTWKSWTIDGWFKMGDLGRFDTEGNLIILGRKKDMIIRGGQNVYPIEIENMLISHPKVLAVAIVGMPDYVMGEKACAYVVPREGVQLALQEIVSFLKEKNIAGYKLPERLELVDTLPIVGDQKVDKKVLEQDIAQKLKAEGVV